MNWFSDNGYSFGKEYLQNLNSGGEAMLLFMAITWLGHTAFEVTKKLCFLLQKNLNLEPIIVELAQEKFYHLDTCFQQFPTGDAIFYPEAFKDQSLSTFESLFNLIPVSEHDANQLACNAVVINNTVIFPSEDIKGN
ncbi:MAG: hypothetical protein Ct9H90mP22_8640 [Gammaproteobacteria bacterium]|nr:MAG: hypothetical protein Ct9H90mP22_8640 [Gammaproteobacteria bacterium]